jgi:hypothetical protein
MMIVPQLIVLIQFDYERVFPRIHSSASVEPKLGGVESDNSKSLEQTRNRRHEQLERRSWGGRIRTYGWLIQNYCVYQALRVATLLISTATVELPKVVVKDRVILLRQQVIPARAARIIIQKRASFGHSLRAA